MKLFGKIGSSGGEVSGGGGDGGKGGGKGGGRGGVASVPKPKGFNRLVGAAATASPPGASAGPTEAGVLGEGSEPLDGEPSGGPPAPRRAAAHPAEPEYEEAYEDGTRPPPPLVDASTCLGCQLPLTRKTRRHCRACGLSVCDACSPVRLPLPHLNLYEPVRVCAPCVEQLFKEEGLDGTCRESSFFCGVEFR
jgi:myotubularin-related protein 3/4